MTGIERIKIVCIKCLTLLMKIYYIFPIQKRQWVFISYCGTKYNDNPKYLSQYIQRNCPDISQIWVFNKDVIDFIDLPESIKKVRNKSLHYYYTILTSQVIIINDGIESFISIRKEQLLINTWHGGGVYKTVSMTSPGANEYVKWLNTVPGRNISAYVLSSEYFKKTVVQDSFLFYGDTIKCGMPRNEVLFQNHPEFISNVERYIGAKIAPQAKVVLYAPTYRGVSENGKLYFGSEPLNIELIKQALEKKYDAPVVFLFRAHHAIKDSFLSGEYYDVSQYPDMQELIYISDILISDYSSCMWDFGLMEKPIIIYVPDLDKYDDDRGFFMNPYEWPYVMIKSNGEIIDKINEFDESQIIHGIRDLNNKLGSYENSEACKKCFDWILRKLEE